MTTNNKDAVEMTVNGEPITEDQLHILYAIGRRGKPTRSDIATQLTKVGIDSKKRKEIIPVLIEANIIIETREPGIGQRGSKVVRYTLTLIGESFYRRAFNATPILGE